MGVPRLRMTTPGNRTLVWSAEVTLGTGARIASPHPCELDLLANQHRQRLPAKSDASELVGIRGHPLAALRWIVDGISGSGNWPPRTTTTGPPVSCRRRKRDSDNSPRMLMASTHPLTLATTSMPSIQHPAYRSVVPISQHTIGSSSALSLAHASRSESSTPGGSADMPTW